MLGIVRLTVGVFQKYARTETRHGQHSLVAATTDPATLPAASTWSVVTTLPLPEVAPAAESALTPADRAEIVRLDGLRQWGEQGDRHMKGALGWAAFQVRSDRAIQRHGQLVCGAFSFCWWAFLRRQATIMVDQALETASAPATEPVGEKREPSGDHPTLSWPVASRQVQSWLDPWTILWRCWRAWSRAPPPPALPALLDAVAHGHPLHLPLRI